MSERDERSAELQPMPRTQTEAQPPSAGAGPLFREHGRTVFRAAYRITGDATDAEDVVQSVFLKLIRNQHLERLSDTPGPYLRRAATNAALDLLRRRKSAGTVQWSDEAPDPPADDVEDPARQLDSRELREVLRRGLAELSPRMAEIFSLRYLEGLKNPEIAEAVGTSTGTVAVTLHRARKALQEHIETALGGAR